MGRRKGARKKTRTAEALYLDRCANVFRSSDNNPSAPLRNETKEEERKEKRKKKKEKQHSLVTGVFYTINAFSPSGRAVDLHGTVHSR